MEEKTFNLNRAISDWRDGLKQRGIAPETIEELEGHLAESTESLQTGGLSEREAFYTAVDRLGEPDDQLGASSAVGSAATERPKLSGCRKAIGITLLSTGCAFILAGLAAIVATYMMPKVYLGKVTIQLGRHQEQPGITHTMFQQTQFKIIESRETRSEVIRKTDLAQRWDLSEELCRQRLKKATRVSGIRGTDLIQITVYDTDPELVATLANTTAQAYKSRLSDPAKVIIHERAESVGRPVKSNVKLQLILTVALVAFGLLGIIIGILTLRAK